MAFSPETFQLLTGLSEVRKHLYVKEREQQFKDSVIGPFQSIFKAVVAGLPEAISSRMETESGVYAKFQKNDYGKGGAWDYYWAAIYSGPTRPTGAQLFMWLNKDRLEFGFYLGVDTAELKERFFNNLDAPSLIEALESTAGKGEYLFGGREQESEPATATWSDWRSNPRGYRASIARIIPRETLLASSEANLVDQGLETFKDLFPFILVATTKDPLDQISSLTYGASSTIKGKAVTTPVDDPLPQALLDETLLDAWELNEYIQAIQSSQVVFAGPPGTGKTWLARTLAEHMVGSDRIRMVQFHPSYGYEEFIQGLRPTWNEGQGGMTFSPSPGTVMRLVSDVLSSGKNHILIMDEMNRANLPRVLGELMLTFEYRDVPVTLQYSEGQTFRLPPELRFVGTMNTADRSIRSIDAALRRRFEIFEFPPRADLLSRWFKKPHNVNKVDGLIEGFERLNDELEKRFNRHHTIGHTFFMDSHLTAEKLRKRWERQVFPLIEEYFFDDPGQAKSFTIEKLWPSVS